MLLHLTSYHQMDKADANELIDGKAKFAFVTPSTRVLGVSGNRHVRRALEDEEDQNKMVGVRAQKKRKNT